MPLQPMPLGVYVHPSAFYNDIVAMRLDRAAIRQLAPALGINLSKVNGPETPDEEILTTLRAAKGKLDALRAEVPAGRLETASEPEQIRNRPLAAAAIELSQLYYALAHQTPATAGGKDIRLQDLWEVAFENRPVAFNDDARANVAKTRAALEQAIAEGRVMYGVNTGFGILADRNVPRDQLQELQRDLILTHAAGTGETVAEPYVRAMMYLRVHSLAQAYSGVRPEVIDLLVSMINKGVTPLVTSRGSVGASGDLVPLSQMAAVMLGEHQAFYQGELLPGAEALRRAGLEPIVLEAKEGLALNNGTPFMTAVAALGTVQADYLVEVADVAAAVVADMTGARIEAFHPVIHKIRRQRGQEHVADKMRSLLLENGQRSDVAANHPKRGKVQDPYDVRTVPQVHGAVRDVMDEVRRTLQNEINAVTDNPIVHIGRDGKIEVLSGGNFHGMPVAFAADNLGMATGRLGEMSWSRIASLLTNTRNSGLETFLVPPGAAAGLRSGLMMVDVNAASERMAISGRGVMHSLQTVPTAGGQEDDVSNGPNAALNASEQIASLARMLGMELAAGLQASSNWGRPSTAPLEGALNVVRREAKPLVGDDARTPVLDLAGVEALLATRSLGRHGGANRLRTARSLMPSVARRAPASAAQAVAVR